MAASAYKLLALTAILFACSAELVHAQARGYCFTQDKCSGDHAVIGPGPTSRPCVSYRGTVDDYICKGGCDGTCIRIALTSECVGGFRGPFDCLNI